MTTVLEPDSSTDTMEQQYAEANVIGRVETETREADISSWEKEFADILTKEPGLTTLAQFRIDTGQHRPICQGPYNTPHALRESVNKELEWLRQKGYIRESNSSWASPMVTVRKPDGSARLCIDFKAINALAILHASSGGGPRACKQKQCDLQDRFDEGVLSGSNAPR